MTGVHWANTVDLLVEACLSRASGRRDTAVNIVQQTLMKDGKLKPAGRLYQRPQQASRADVEETDTGSGLGGGGGSGHQPGIHAIDCAEIFSRVIKEL